MDLVGGGGALKPDPIPVSPAAEMIAVREQEEQEPQLLHRFKSVKKPTVLLRTSDADRCDHSLGPGAVNLYPPWLISSNFGQI